MTVAPCEASRPGPIRVICYFSQNTSLRKIFSAVTTVPPLISRLMNPVTYQVRQNHGQQNHLSGEDASRPPP